jgi:hypothetical protein
MLVSNAWGKPGTKVVTHGVTEHRGRYCWTTVTVRNDPGGVVRPNADS